MVITSDEVASLVEEIWADWAKEHYADFGERHDELHDVVSVVRNGSTLTVTVTDIARTTTQTFTVVVHG